MEDSPRKNYNDHRNQSGSYPSRDKTDRSHQPRPNRSRSRSPIHSSRRRSRSPVYRSNQPQQRGRSSTHPLRHRSRSRSPKPPLKSNPQRSPRALRISEQTHDRASQDKSTTSRSISTNLHKQDDDHRSIQSPRSPEDQIAPKDEPNFNLSGKLAAETKTFKGVVLKYHEPPEARKPTKNWRLYVFKGTEQIDIFHIHRQSAYLFGRDRVVVDIPIDHPSSSKQHAVIQFRQISSTNEFGDSKTIVKPFIIDLESANGTSVNGEKIPVSRFYELQSGDVIKFGFSTREFVLIPET